MMLTLVFLRFIGEKFEDGVENLRKELIAQGLDPDDQEIFKAFFDDATFTDGTYKRNSLGHPWLFLFNPIYR